MSTLKKYYETLNLEEEATPEEIKKAYRQCAKKWHPDNFINDPEKAQTAEAKFLEIHQAYEVLKNKAQYFNNNSIENKDNNNSVFVNKDTFTKEKKAQLYYQLGAMEAESEEWEEAIKYFTLAIKTDETFINAYYYRGAVLEKLGLNLRAENDLTKAESLKAKDMQNNDLECNYFFSTSKIHKKKRKQNIHNYQSKLKIKNNYQKVKGTNNLSIVFVVTIILVAFSFALVNSTRDSNNDNQNSLSLSRIV